LSPLTSACSALGDLHSGLLQLFRLPIAVRLAAVVAAWPELPEAVRASIMMLIKAAK
jgi:hypothetical protein